MTILYLHEKSQRSPSRRTPQTIENCLHSGGQRYDFGCSQDGGGVRRKSRKAKADNVFEEKITRRERETGGAILLSSLIPHSLLEESMADDNLIPFDPTKAPQKPVGENLSPEGTEPVITVDQLINQAVGQGCAADHLKRAANHIEELAMMLYEARDPGVPRDNPDVKYLADTARGIQILMSSLAEEIKNCAGYMTNLSNAASALKKQREEGGAE